MELSINHEYFSDNISLKVYLLVYLFCPKQLSLQSLVIFQA